MSKLFQPPLFRVFPRIKSRHPLLPALYTSNVSRVADKAGHGVYPGTWLLMLLLAMPAAVGLQQHQSEHADRPGAADSREVADIGGDRAADDERSADRAGCVGCRRASDGVSAGPACERDSRAEQDVAHRQCARGPGRIVGAPARSGGIRSSSTARRIAASIDSCRRLARRSSMSSTTSTSTHISRASCRQSCFRAGRLRRTRRRRSRRELTRSITPRPTA